MYKMNKSELIKRLEIADKNIYNFAVESRKQSTNTLLLEENIEDMDTEISYLMSLIAALKSDIDTFKFLVGDDSELSSIFQKMLLRLEQNTIDDD